MTASREIDDPARSTRRAGGEVQVRGGPGGGVQSLDPAPRAGARRRGARRASLGCESKQMGKHFLLLQTLVTIGPNPDKSC